MIARKWVDTCQLIEVLKLAHKRGYFLCRLRFIGGEGCLRRKNEEDWHSNMRELAGEAVVLGIAVEWDVRNRYYHLCPARAA
jgi:hypothetical protein